MIRAILLGCALAAGIVGIASAQNQPVRIGFSISKSGFLAPGAAEQLRVYELWREQINAKGGLDLAGTKRPVAYVEYDDRSDAATAIKIYEKLITDDKVDLLFAPYGAPITLPIVPLLEKMQVPMIANTATSVHIRELKPGNIWFVSPTVHDHIASELVKMIKAKGLASVAVISNSIPPATEIIKFLIPDLKAAGIEIKVNETYPPDIGDMTALLTRVKRAQADAVVVLSIFPDAVLFTRQSRELGLDAKLQFVAIGPAVAAYRKMFGASANGIVALGIASPFRKEWTLAQPFFDAYGKKYGEEPDYLDGMLPYMSSEVVEQAVAKSGLDMGKFRQVVSTGTFDTVAGPVKFHGVENELTPVSFIQIQDGQIQLVWPPKIATAPFQPMAAR